jgi:hypothetical protein
LNTKDLKGRGDQEVVRRAVKEEERRDIEVERAEGEERERRRDE